MSLLCINGIIKCSQPKIKKIQKYIRAYGGSPPTYRNISTKDINPSIQAFEVSLCSPSSSYTGLLAVIWVHGACIFYFTFSTCSFKDIVVVYWRIFTTGDSRRLQELNREQYSTFCHFQNTISRAHTGPRRERKSWGRLYRRICRMEKRFLSFLYFSPLCLRCRKRPHKEFDKILEGSMVCKWQKSLGTHSISHLKAVTAVLNILVRNICHRSLYEFMNNFNITEVNALQKKRRTKKHNLCSFSFLLKASVTILPLCLCV